MAQKKKSQSTSLSKSINHSYEKGSDYGHPCLISEKFLFRYIGDHNLMVHNYQI